MVVEMWALISAICVSIGRLKSCSFGNVLRKRLILLGNKFMRPRERLLL